MVSSSITVAGFFVFILLTPRGRAGPLVQVPFELHRMILRPCRALPDPLEVALDRGGDRDAQVAAR
jgi:hypothetical protein